MNKIWQCLLAMSLLFIGIYFSKNDPLGARMAVAQTGPERFLAKGPAYARDLFHIFHDKAQYANVLLVAMDDQEMGCTEDKMRISQKSQKLHAELNQLATRLLNSTDFSAELKFYIRNCRKDCTCSVLSTLEKPLETYAYHSPSFREDLKLIQEAVLESQSETLADRARCVNQLGELCEIINP